MTDAGFQRLKVEVLQMLDDGLDPRLTYHCPEHTVDVMLQAARIAEAENITDSRSLLLVQIASLFHDTGFLSTYHGHEEKSCEIMLDVIDSNWLSPSEIKMIFGMIMATKIPQSPDTVHEMIICDADLDYLGREDFEIISDRLRIELLAYGTIQNDKEWNHLQVHFFENHQYHTVTSRRHRHPVKMRYLEKLRRKI